MPAGVPCRSHDFGFFELPQGPVQHSRVRPIQKPANYFFTMTMAFGPLPDGTEGWAMGVSVPVAPMVY